MNMIDDNILLATDSYKISHAAQLPPGTTRIHSFQESRGGLFPETVFFGLQYFMKRYLSGRAVQNWMIDEARGMCAAHFGDPSIFNRAGWAHILREHGGRLPVEIRAVREGSVVPTHNVLMTIENTDPKVPWLTNYLETLLSMTWYPTTVATQSRAMRQIILAALERTGDPALIDFKLHDFGFRGSTSVESAGIGGCAHMVNFRGTDTMEALRVARDYYGEPMAGFSIPAAEHSTITSWGRTREADAYRNMLDQFPTGLVAVVSDSYDIYNACRIWGGELREKVMGRNGTLVIRPDSGDPVEVLGNMLVILADRFGATRNAKGFYVLDPHVRIIQGDGIDRSMLAHILEELPKAGWSADNIAFGSGGGLLQKVDRDTQKFAIKCSAVEINGEWHDVMKDPITDPGKRSKAGRLTLTRSDAGYMTQRVDAFAQSTAGRVDQLRTVFLNGEMLDTQTLSEIRARAVA